MQAEKWVSNMSKLPAEDESFETESRPARSVHLCIILGVKRAWLYLNGHCWLSFCHSWFLHNSIIFCRLGLGAKVPRTSTFVPSDDPLERKLYYKLNAQKRKAAKIAEALAPAARDDDDDDEDNLDSRTCAFEKKKRAADPVTPSVGKKKRRK